MTELNKPSGTASAADFVETAASCLRANAELNSRLAAAWLDIFTPGAMQLGLAGTAPSMAHWGLEAMRLTAETTLRNIERCQDCAHRASGGKT